MDELELKEDAWMKMKTLMMTRNQEKRKRLVSGSRKEMSWFTGQIKKQ